MFKAGLITVLLGVSIISNLLFASASKISSCPDAVLTYVDNGNQNFTFTLSIDFSSVPCSTLDTLIWDFGDGTVLPVPVSNLSISHQYAVGPTQTYDVNAHFYASSPCRVGCDVTIPLVVEGVDCPVSAFVPLKNSAWCNTGEYTLGWANCQTAGPGAYWTAQYVVWNMGDGTIITTQGMDQVSHTYASAGTVQISATAYFTGLNGEFCSTNLIYIPDAISSGDPCGYIYGTSQIFPFLELDTYVANPDLYTSSGPFCQNDLISLYDAGSITPQGQNILNWSYQVYMDGNLILDNPGLPNNSTYFAQSTLPAGDHLFELVYTYQSGDVSCSVTDGELVQIDSCVVDTCELCLNFAPEVGNRYWISGWVKENHTSEQKTYNNTSLQVEFIGTSTSTVNFTTSGSIIEGWQRIVGSFTVPNGTTDLNIHLVNDGTNEAYFDDIRVHPFNASMKSYVYDPETLWLLAELDDNNYATFYEYDQEGQLIRIKKETSRGIMTIQESRSSNPKN